MKGRKPSQVAQGVDMAWSFWLSQHPVSVPDIIEMAVEKAARTALDNWLDTHTEEIVRAIAKNATPIEEIPE